MAEHKIAVFITSRQRTRVAIHSQNRRTYLRALLPNNQPPRRFAFRTSHSFHFPQPVDRGRGNSGGRWRDESLRLNRKEFFLRRTPLPLQQAVFQCRRQLSGVVVETQSQRSMLEVAARGCLPFISVEEPALHVCAVSGEFDLE